MKKLISIILVCILLTASLSISVSAYKIGDVVGYALSTDIAATINGYDIPSYNVNGYTYIVVEDLRYYGFSVIYDNPTRSLSVTRDFSQMYVSKVYQKPYISPEKIGEIEHKILFTNIVTYLDGNYVHTYNINGQTIIRFDALAAYGSISYDNNIREISATISNIATNPNPINLKEPSKVIADFHDYDWYNPDNYVEMIDYGRTEVVFEAWGGNVTDFKIFYLEYEIPPFNQGFWDSFYYKEGVNKVIYERDELMSGDYIITKLENTSDLYPSFGMIYTNDDGVTKAYRLFTDDLRGAGVRIFDTKEIKILK